MGRPLPNRYSGCTTNVYNLDAYAGARGFDPELYDIEKYFKATVITRLTDLESSAFHEAPTKNTFIKSKI